MKKDEDADQTMIKLDRTSVFQDGKGTGLANDAPTALQNTPEWLLTSGVCRRSI